MTDSLVSAQRAAIVLKVAMLLWKDTMISRPDVSPVEAKRTLLLCEH
jgi:hypothetical protein